MLDSRLRHQTALALAAGIGCSFLTAACAMAQVAPKSVATLVPALDSLAATEYARDSIGSFTVGVIAGSDLVWTKSYGYADMKAKKLAARQTVYRIGSITKPFTAVMLLQLVHAGTLRLSDPIESYFPEIKTVGGFPKGAAPVTFLQLATMTAGLAREPRQEGPFWTGPVSKWEQTLIAALPHTSYETFPGTRFSYSNIGYAILGAALARAAGQPYVEWERTHVLEPLGMHRTRFELDPAIQSDFAQGYTVQNGNVEAETAAAEAREGRGYKVPNGAIFTTVDDLARFVEFELGHGPAAVLPRARLDSAFSGIVASSAELNGGYGLGFMATRHGSHVFTGHDGGVAGYTASMLFSREDQVGVVVFRNAAGGRANPNRLAADILSRLVSGLATRP